MRSIDSYKKSIKKIASDLEITGDHVELLSSILAYSLYTNEINLLRYTNELSLYNSNFLSSKIIQSVDRMYSVYRGMNPVIELTFHTTEKFSFKIGDLVYASNDFYLYSIENKEINASTSEISKIKVYITKGPKIVSTLIGDNVYYKNITGDNISERVLIKKISNNSVSEVVTTRYFKNHIEDESSPLLVMTVQDYAIRLYNRDKFKSLDEYQIEMYTYFDDMNIISNLLINPEYPQIQIKGMDLLNADISSELIPRESTINIEYNAQSNLFSSGIMKSNTDVIDLFKSMSPTLIKDTSFKWDNNNNRLIIYYVTYDNKLFPIENKNLFLMNLNKSYYIGESPELLEGSKVEVNLIIDIKTYLEVDYVNELVIKNRLESYERTLGKSININEIQSDLSRIEGVKYVKIIEGKSYLDGIEFTRPDKLNFNQFMIINPKINITQDAYSIRSGAPKL